MDYDNTLDSIVRENVDAAKDRERERQEDYEVKEATCTKCGIDLLGPGVCGECSGEAPYGK